MIYVFSGSDRVKIQAAISKILGSSYEVFEGAELDMQDLVNIFQGATLFSAERKILIKDLTPAPKGKEADGSSAGDGARNEVGIGGGTSAGGEVLAGDEVPAGGEVEIGSKAGAGAVDYYGELIKYAKTPHTIVIWESYTSRKKSFKEFVALKNVQTKKFEAAKPADARLVFDVLDTAYRDGGAAVKMIEKIKTDNDPYMFFGLLVSQALKKGDRRVLKELSDLDMKMKTSTIEPWALISSFLLSVSSL